MRLTILLIFLFGLSNVTLLFIEWAAFTYLDPLACALIIILHVIALIYTPYNKFNIKLKTTKEKL